MSRRAESVDCGCVDGVGFGGGFAFIVVLFILLIIVGASFCGGVALAPLIFSNCSGCSSLRMCSSCSSLRRHVLLNTS